MKFLILMIAFYLVAAQSPPAEVVTSNKSHTANNGRNKGNGRENAAVSRRPVKLNLKQGLVMNQILGMYTLNGELNDRCRNHSKELKIGLRALEPWALQMFDSSSKLQAGILEGNLFEFGSYRQCVQVYKSTEFGPIRGKYCSIRIRPDLDLMRRILEFRNITRKRFVKLSQFVSNTAFVWALCVPDSCSIDDVLQHFNGMLFTLTEGLNLTVSLTENDCATIQQDEKPFSTTELSVVIALGIFLLIVAVSTTVDLYYSTPEEASSNKLVQIFSAYSNSRQIFARSKDASDLDCVHGIRFLSTFYVLICHRYVILMFFPVINSLKILDWLLFYRSTFISTGGTLCVDTFFMLSGMLVSLGFFREVAKSGRMNWPIFYLYRYMRITPPLALVVLIYATLVHHLGSGPLWQDMLDGLQKPCREYWWAALLHVQNYVHPFPLCVAQTWYLTCEMHFFFFSPLILVPLWKWPIFGCINFALLYTFSIVCPFYFAWINKYDGGLANQLFFTKYFTHFYIVPHTRAATYIIGLGFGYSIHKSKKIRFSYSFAVLGWITATATMLAALVGCHVFHLEEHEFNRLEASIYLSCSRSAWTFGVVWTIWACLNGYGGPINSLLSLHVFRVLGRISYAIFLLHMLLQYWTGAVSKTPGYFSDLGALSAAFSDLFIMVIIGFVFTVCFESPLVKALALIIRRRSSRKVTDQTKDTSN